MKLYGKMKCQASVARAPFAPGTTAIGLAIILFALAPRTWSAARTVPRGRAGETQNTGAAESKPNPDAKRAQQDAVPVRLPKGKKLVLTDGTFLLVREYSVEDDRVRYWSVERSAWEEIPSNLVDWDGTRKAEADQAKQDAELKAKLRASEIAERTKDIDVDRSLEIKPGLFLPDGAGFYALEDRLISEMKQSGTTSTRDKSREIARILSGQPIPGRLMLEIPGEHAAMHIHTLEPEFFMRPADDRDPKFVLIRAQVGGGHRLLESANVHQSGEVTHHSQTVDFQTWNPARGVFRYTVERPLEPGEYAFVEMTSEGIADYVWDFTVDAPRTKPSK